MYKSPFSGFHIRAKQMFSAWVPILISIYSKMVEIDWTRVLRSNNVHYFIIFIWKRIKGFYILKIQYNLASQWKAE
jgi:hypothetical protein